MLSCTSATKLPSAIVTTAITATTIQTSEAAISGLRKTRRMTAKPAAFGPTDRKAVMVVGAPS